MLHGVNRYKQEEFEEASMADESNSKSSKGRKVTINLPELDRIILLTKSNLGKDDYAELRSAYEVLCNFLHAPFRNSEKADEVLGDTPDEPVAAEKPKKPGHGRTPLGKFKGAKEAEVKHPDLKPGQPCPCGCGGKVYLVKRRLKIRRFSGQPPIVLTIYSVEQLRCNVCDEMFPAPLPEKAGFKTYDATAVSQIALFKYGAGVPFYRQAGLLGCLGVPIAVATQYEVVAAAIPEIRPAYTELVRLAAQAKLSYMDDTWMRILNFTRPPGDKRTGIHTSAILADNGAYRIGLFFTGREHAGENATELRKLREPNLPAMIQMSDALSCNFTGLGSDDAIVACCCLVHGRRNFVKIVDSFPKDCRYVIKTIGSIYGNDKHCRENNLDPTARLRFHQENSGPPMEELNKWLNERFDKKLVERNSLLGKAIQYMLNQWEEMTQFLRVAGAPLDSSLAEQAIKKVILHRKNSLFYKTAKGAMTGDIYMSLIYTCQLNGANPFEYLTELQRNAAEVKAKPGEWMPWNYARTLQQLHPLALAS
jgi:transposase